MENDANSFIEVKARLNDINGQSQLQTFNIGFGTDIIPEENITEIPPAYPEILPQQIHLLEDRNPQSKKKLSRGRSIFRSILKLLIMVQAVVVICAAIYVILRAKRSECLFAGILLL